MSRKLLLSALISTVMMGGFVVSSYAQSGEPASSYADCTNSHVLSKASVGGELQSLLILAVR